MERDCLEEMKIGEKWEKEWTKERGRNERIPKKMQIYWQKDSK